MSIVVVGEVSPAFLAALDSAGADLQRYELDDVPRRWPADGSYLLVAVPGDLEDGQGPVDDWLSLLPDGIGVAATTPRATHVFLYRVLLPTGAFPVVETDTATAVDWERAALDLLAASAPATSEEDTVPLGTVFRRPTGPQDYEGRRSMSLVSASMRTFLAELAEAIRVMTAGPDRLPPIPWDPHDSLPPRRTGTNGSWDLPATGDVNLTDVYYAPRSSRGRALLRNTPELLEQARRAWRPLPPNLLVLGESGTGKTLVAELVHRTLAIKAVRPPHQVPFRAVNCAGMGAENFDHTMFGCSPGYWSGTDAIVGQLARAAYGVAFLDEIGDMRPDGQARLLRFLDDQLITPAGIDPFLGHVRVVAATNRALTAMVSRQEFRHDLLARFSNVVRIPPLRDRGQDEIAGLVDFVAQNPLVNPLRVDGEPAVAHISRAAVEGLCAHDYRDGNFRELEATVHQAVRAALRRRSRVVSVRDVAFSGAAFIDEADVRVVHVAGPPKVGAEPVRVVTALDLDRLALLARTAVLVAPDGSRHVVAGGVAYRFG